MQIDVVFEEEEDWKRKVLIFDFSYLTESCFYKMNACSKYSKIPSPEPTVFLHEIIFIRGAWKIVSNFQRGIAKKGYLLNYLFMKIK